MGPRNFEAHSTRSHPDAATGCGIRSIADCRYRVESHFAGGQRPTTAISSVDQLSRILIRFASRETPESNLYDPPGVFRVHVPWIGFERLLDSAFEQIRSYSRSDVAVSLRLLRALGDIAITTPDPLFRRILAERGRRVIEGCAGPLGEEELKPLRARAAALERSH